jgi:hypothetical protein
VPKYRDSRSAVLAVIRHCLICRIHRSQSTNTYPDFAVGRAAWVKPKQRLGSEYEMDFLIAQQRSSGLIFYAVELEPPQAILFTKKGDPPAALTHAFRQISDWRE